MFFFPVFFPVFDFLQHELLKMAMLQNRGVFAACLFPLLLTAKVPTAKLQHQLWITRVLTLQERQFL